MFADYLAKFKRYRTPVLAVLATVMLVCSAVWSFDVPWSEIIGYLIACLLGVTVIVISAALVVFLFKWVQGRGR